MIRRWIYPALRWVRIGLLLLLDTLTSLWPRKSGDAALVIRLDAIGDFVIWLQSGAADIAIELRRTHPQLILLANTSWASLARELGVWDEVVSVDPARFVRNPIYRATTLWMTRRLGFSSVVQPRAARLFLLEDAIVRACGAPVRVGSEALSANMPNDLRVIGDRSYTTIVPVPLSLKVHESVRDLAFARAFCEASGTVIAATSLTSAASSHGIVPESDYLVVAVGAGWSGRQWPIEKFAELLSALGAQHGLLCVVVGSSAERPLAAKLAALTTARLTDLTGQLSLSESIRVISQAKLLVANESGPMHIGIWCGTPVIGLVGGGHFGWFAPYPDSFPMRGKFAVAHVSMDCFGCNWHCKFNVAAGAAVPCVSGIQSSDVFELAARFLQPTGLSILGETTLTRSSSPT
jgi:ADP-heptose:LPS heptosyltransferase